MLDELMTSYVIHRNCNIMQQKELNRSRNSQRETSTFLVTKKLTTNWVSWH